jgi:hypothetical protein
LSWKRNYQTGIKKAITFWGIKRGQSLLALPSRLNPASSPFTKGGLGKIIYSLNIHESNWPPFFLRP